MLKNVPFNALPPSSEIPAKECAMRYLGGVVVSFHYSIKFI